jgi:hypothetical protein
MARRVSSLFFLIGLPLCVIGTVVNAVWTVSHNALNVNCNNFIYLNAHRRACDTWLLHNGYVTAATVPFIVLGALVAVGGGIVWLILVFDPDL